MVGKRLGVLLLLLLVLASSHSTHHSHIGDSHDEHGEEGHSHADHSGHSTHEKHSEHRHSSPHEHSHAEHAQSGHFTQEKLGEQRSSSLHEHSHGHAHGHSHGESVFGRYFDLAALQRLSEQYGTKTSAYVCTGFLSVAAIVVFAVLGAVRKCALISEDALNALMACAAGSLLGDVFLHALPEMDKSMDSWVLVISGVFLFYLLDKVFSSDHSHTHTHTPVFLYLLADAVHNFMDGMAIAVAFRAKPILGITTSLAVLFHELPHELADFVVLLKSGRSLGKALWLQCLTGLLALAGTWVALADVSKAQVDRVGLPLVVGNFLYLAMVSILGDLRTAKGGLLSQSVGFLLGAYLMLNLSLLE